MWQSILAGLMVIEQTVGDENKRVELEKAIVDGARFALKLTNPDTVLGKIASKIDEIGKAEGL